MDNINWCSCVVLGWAGLGWAGEDERQWAGRPSDEQQAGLGWAGLGWAGLGWAGMAVTHIRVEAWAGGERTDM